MVALLKQHALSNTIFNYVSILLFLAVAYFIALPPIFLFLIVFLALLLSLFIFDHTGKVNRFLVSLPVPKKRVVQSRYVALLLAALLVGLYQWLIMHLFSIIFEIDYYVYGWQDIVIVFCLGSLLTSFSLPIMYYFRSTYMSISIVFIMYCTSIFFSFEPLARVLTMKDEVIFNDLDRGFKLLIEKYIPYQPYLLLMSATFILLYASIKLSERLYLKKDF